MMPSAYFATTAERTTDYGLIGDGMLFVSKLRVAKVRNLVFDLEERLDESEFTRSVLSEIVARADTSLKEYLSHVIMRAYYGNSERDILTLRRLL